MKECVKKISLQKQKLLEIKNLLNTENEIKDKNYPDEKNIDNFIWVSTPDGIIGDTLCHYEFIFHPDTSDELQTEVHFEIKKYINFFKQVQLDKKLDFIDWEENHKRIVFHDRSIKINDPKFTVKAIKCLRDLHNMVGEQLKQIIYSIPYYQKAKTDFFSEPVLSKDEGSIINHKHYRAVPARVAKELDSMHGKIQEFLLNDRHLNKYEYIHKEKTFEGMPFRIDVLAKLKNKDSYDVFEVKTGITATDCIREAFGQILFYKYLLEKGKYKIHELIIVGPVVPTYKDNEYLESLRKICPELRYRGVEI